MKEQSHLSPLQLELHEATRDWGCPLCRITDKATALFIDSLTYERVLDFQTRNALKAARGLCEEHSRYWQQQNGTALGIAIVNHISVLDLLRETGGAIDDPAPEVARQMAKRGLRFGRRHGAAELANQLESKGECPACALSRSTAELFGDLLLKEVRDDTYASLLTSSGGLCLDHLRMVLRRPTAGKAYARLLEIHRQAWQTLRQNLEEFIRKNDYRFVDEKLSQEEASSWYRVLDILTGYEEYSN